MPSIEEIKKNIVDFCSNSERRSILKAVRKPSHYAAVAKKTGDYRTTCSEVLRAMVPLELVEEIGKRKGIYRQTPIVRGLNIDSVIHAASLGTRPRTSPSGRSQPKVRTIKVPTPDIEKILDNLKVERVIKRDCFPLRPPYRKDVGEAYLTLENVMKDELGIQHARNMMDVVGQARANGLFKRTEQSEEDGLNQLFNASALWLRNPPHHRKDVIPKDDALKMVLFADYLIKLVRRQKKLNKIPSG